MSRKISVLGPEGAQALSLLARLDVAELLLVAPGAGPVADEIAETVAHADSRRRVHGSEDAGDLRGSAVVVLARPASDAELHALARTAPDAVLVVAGGDVATECGRVLEATALPRPRVVGAARETDPTHPQEGSAEIAAAVYLDRGRVLRCVARCQGEAGLDGVQAVRARVGAGGVTEILGGA
jgi:malate/lactate dehydrogenase